MADGALLLAFLVAASVLTVTPGVDTVMVLRAATLHGRRAAISAGLGIALGCLIWGAAVSLGLGAVLRASAFAYTVVKLAGAAYLLWIGLKLLFKPRSSLDPGREPQGFSGGKEAFWRGFLTNILNPKIGVFYVTFLPQFVPPGASVASYSFYLACLHVMLTLCWFAALIAATVPLGRFLRQPRALGTLDRITGSIFVLFGLKLASSSAR